MCGHSRQIVCRSWGESAGSESVAFHMLVNGGNTEGLFRAGWMESGSVNPAGNISNVQPHFDFIASETGCADEIDILECLREVPTSVIQAAVDKTSTYVSFQVYIVYRYFGVLY